MAADLAFGLLLGATAATGLLAGASLDQSVKQLPARHRIGAAAFARYSEAADLANGVALYASLGIAAAALNLAAFVAAWLGATPSAGLLPLAIGAALAIAHSLVTAWAAALNFSQRRAENEAALGAIFDRFARLQALRCIFQCLNFGVNLWALVVLARH